MNRCWARVLWIVSATAPTSSSSRAILTANVPPPDRRPSPKPAGKPRPELWRSSRKLVYGHLNETFFGLRRRKEARPRKSGHLPVASARTAVKDQARFAALPLV